MCIRDRDIESEMKVCKALDKLKMDRTVITISHKLYTIVNSCLLYTSDAADERSSVDLGGRRIIKKKKKWELICRSVCVKENNKSMKDKETNER